MLREPFGRRFRARIKRTHANNNLLLHDVVAHAVAVLDRRSETRHGLELTRHLAARYVIVAESFRGHVVENGGQIEAVLDGDELEAEEMSIERRVEVDHVGCVVAVSVYGVSQSGRFFVARRRGGAHFVQEIERVRGGRADYLGASEMELAQRAALVCVA